MSNPEYKKIFTSVAENLIQGPGDEYFQDCRGGFICILLWADSFIKNMSSSNNRELALQHLEKCRIILAAVTNNGWTAVTKRAAKEHAAQMKNQHCE
ncbi:MULTISPECIES: hypothetical protein [Deefgea]|uniref:Uncharacterized protein n=1 Tax=Deefgea chitinilytica TaxID=570276 RepID=A0ABS2CFH9_9NEIS|nr:MULTISPECIES: hypothetical protein [Deefgea]MBM5572911.1 hypothetical protein [Deefgea chitinilytica]MBM9890147.1 hypothetical protein [Deefgea sp. CFH1-16]